MKKIVFKKDTTKGYNKNGIYIEKGVLIKKGTCIWSNNIILAGSKLCGCECLPNNFIEGAVIGSGCVIGPFARIRKATIIGNDCKIGNFCEIKNSTIGDNTKIAHLTYVGDAFVGNNCNIGCGTVFCNFDGEKKSKTTLGDNCFIGSNSNLIAPLEIGNNCFVASGTVVTINMPNDTFAISRTMQVNKPNKKTKIKSG